MNSIFARLGGVLLASVATATAAQATVTAALTENYALTSNPVFANVANFDLQSIRQANFDASTGIPGGIVQGATFVGASRLTESEIYFKNGLIALGTASEGRIGVAVTFTNTHSFSYRPVLQSTLLAAGMGLGVANFYLNDGLFGPQTCNTTQLKNCGALDTSDPNIGAIYPNGLSSFNAASAGFDFDVSVNGASIYNLNGQMTSSGNGIVETFNGADQVLRNFTRVRSDLYGTAYTWDDTQIDIELPDMLDPGQSVTAIYTITTKAASPVSGISWTTNGRTTGANVIAYSSFGDPTGGKTPISPDSEMINALSSGLNLAAGNVGLNGVNMGGSGAFRIPLEMVDEATQTVTALMTGTTTFAANNPFPYGGGPDPQPQAVPEPAMLSLFGLGAAGLIGARVRRRPAKAAAA